MGKTVRAVLIDPWACSVSQVDHDADNIHETYRLLSHQTNAVSLLAVNYPDIPFDENDTIYSDHDGLLKPIDRYFKVPGGQVIAGKGLVVGSDLVGEVGDFKTPFDLIRRTTFFLERIEAVGLVRTFNPWTPRHVAA